tara:strand:- start:4000 stop:5934 length:1935 start_codon:yes stop_codon:yes gene_type:complete
MSHKKNIDDYLNTPIFQGGRNHALFIAAAACKDNGYNQAEAERALHAKALGDGLKPGEIAQTINSAFARPVSDNPRLEGNTIGNNLSWDDDLSGLVHAPKKKIEVYKAEIPPPASDWANDLKRLCEVAFDSTDTINIVDEYRENEHGKPIPKGRGKQYPVQKILDATPEQLELIAAHGRGGWLRINPTDGKGIADKNITNFKHVLVESDTLGLGEQLAIYRELQLPVSCIIHSGSKSLHAWVRVEATNIEQYKKRAAYIYELLEAQGFEIDLSNKNPSRLSRLVGVQRDGSPQYLIADRSGQPDFESWVNFWETKANGLPEIESFDDIDAEAPELAPELITGILRQGHKMIIAGPSKAGKSFALINLALSVASGRDFLGFPTKKGPILYVNFEIDRASFYHRVKKVAEELNITDTKDLDVWNLRGKSAGIEDLAPQIIRKIKKRNYSAVILDPTYKFMGDRDENNAGDITSLMNYLDQISVQSGCSIILAAHFSKGQQGQKNQADRISGSGVFGRDPDCIICLSEIKDEPDAYLMEGTLREFKAIEPVGLRFEYPIHILDSSLNSAVVDGAEKKKKGTTDQDLLDQFLILVGGDLEETKFIKELAISTNLSERTLKGRINKMGFNSGGMKLTVKSNLVRIEQLA